ncbi:DNA transposase [Frankliniella fusca]|uniref:DNA transposase n=1 Tax=Frankliniella fusca TaxID=407009 RepID=A0AAE1LH66_9NEOP|nr:DNA transposase [Frankliniella fusca]
MAFPDQNLPPSLSPEFMLQYPVTSMTQKEPAKHLAREDPSGEETAAHVNVPDVPFAPEPDVQMEDTVLELTRPEAAGLKTPEAVGKRVTKASIARDVGLSSGQVTPKKKALIHIAQRNYQNACNAKRNLKYAGQRAQLLNARAKLWANSANHLRSAEMSFGGRLVLEVYKNSPKTYRKLRACITLPSEKTLKDALGNIKLEPGISPLLLKVLKNKVERMEEKTKICAVLFDEVFVNEGLYYNPITDTVEGFEDFGVGGRTDREANHCLVVMVRGLCKEWKMPVAFYPVNGTCPSTTLAVLLPQVITKLQEIGLKVEASVSDQGPTNRGAIALLRAASPEREHDPIYFVDGQKIIHLYDFPHLLKSVRNNLITNESLSKISKLQYAHLAPVGRNKMRVCLAAQVFSESVASGMKTFHTLSGGTKLSHTLLTMDLVLFMDKLFDSVNGPGRKDNEKKYRQNVTADSFHHSFWIEARRKLSKWVFIRKSTGDHHVPPCILGFIESLTGLGLLWNKLKSLGCDTLILRNTNQDPLENYFRELRSSNGNNMDPTVPQLFAAAKTTIACNIPSIGREGNCEDNDCDFLVQLEAMLNEAGSGIEGPEGPEGPLLQRGLRPAQQPATTATREFMRQTQSLNCATICSKLLISTDRCEQCTKDLTADEDSQDFVLQLLQETSAALDKPSPKVTNFYIMAQKILDKQWQQVGYKVGIKAIISDLLTGLLNWITCSAHKDHIKTCLLNMVVVRIIHLKCKQYNTSVREGRVKQTRQVKLSNKSKNVDDDLGLNDISSADWQLLTGLTEIDAAVAKHLQIKDPLQTSMEQLSDAIQTRPADTINNTLVVADDNNSLLEAFEAATATSAMDSQQPPPVAQTYPVCSVEPPKTREYVLSLNLRDLKSLMKSWGLKRYSGLDKEGCQKLALEYLATVK